VEFSASAVKSLEKKGVIRVQRTVVSRLPFDWDGTLADDFELTPAQRDVLETIRSEEGDKRFLLHGVTGSGKTEIYIRVIRDCMEQGKTAILLVPEIALTPQTYFFLKCRFQETIAVFHSGLSAGERFDEWKKVKMGEARIVLGARSAVFAPLENIGAIVIDEQHESSYKSDHYPRYTAADIARRRCELNDAVLILGSATPDIETYHEAERGAYTLLKLPERLFGLQLPAVTVVDMREELRRGNRGVISGELYDKLDDALRAGKQAMLFLNRRGYSTFVMCRACGYTVQCEACDITLTYHKAQNHLRCHYCGRTEAVQKTCPACGKPYLKYFGIGTQQVEEQVRGLFPDARVIRMDMDTMGTKDAHLKAFEAFSAGEADILIGTQMITKGFDFENVAISAVLAADTMLNLPDYRSAEYTFSQITQIAGRAGRKSPGSVTLQTYNPEHYAIRYARQHDYEGFYRHEIALRKIALLPPFALFVQIQFAGEKEELVIQCVKDFLTRLKTVLLPRKSGIISVKASESPIRRINHRARYHILIKLKNQDTDIADDIYRLFSEAEYKDVLMGIDINPAGMT
jgi:primosomal protein N' (replication factor Y)